MPGLKTLPKRLASVPTTLPTISPDSWRAGKASSTARGYGYKWQQARAGYLRSHPLCVMCQADGLVTVATVVDHIEPHRGDMARFWQVSNWQALCATHHSSHKQAAEALDGR